jgi:HD-like signal output (HDOD) protein/nitrogen-specific signal transduction histidine kinase
MQSIHLKDRNYSVENLPSEPSLLVHLLELCHNDNANFEMFASAIQKDASLTSKVLQVANSPAYRQWNKINDVRRMLIVLGMTNIRNIVTTCAIQQFFSRFTSSFNRNVQFTWLRSLVCANLAERIAKLIGYDKPGEAFLAGLLHQVGMLLLLLNREKEYLPLMNRYYEETNNFCDLEQRELQLDHCELGAALVDSWDLDSFVADAIQFQHAPATELMSSPVLLKIMAVASPLSSNNGARHNRPYLEKAGKLFNMTEDTILDCIDVSIEKSKQMISDLGFSGRFYMEEDEGNLFDDNHYQKTTDKLSGQIKNIALCGSLSHSDSIELFDFTKEIRANFNTLFNINQLFFFQQNDDKSLLSAINDLEINQLDEIEFNTDDKHSLLVRVFQDKTAHVSLEESCSIADRQVIRLLGSEGAYFLPINYKDNHLGVMAIGTGTNDWPQLQKQAPLFKLLNHEIAKKLFSFKKEEEQPQGMSLVDFKKVAHEVSNPLTIINNYLYMLGKKIDSDHPAQEELKFISEEIERTGQILLRAKDPDSPSRGREKQIDINQLINEIDTLFKSSLYKTNKIKSTLILDQNIPYIYSAKDKLKQILLNIIKNAIEALNSDGKIEITTRDNFYQNSQQYVEISIKDNGPGIPHEILSDLFHPVTSTKEGHSGLGLSIVNTLVSEISGLISCYSKQEEGTEFKILIPRLTELSDFEAN